MEVNRTPLFFPSSLFSLPKVAVEYEELVHSLLFSLFSNDCEESSDSPSPSLFPKRTGIGYVVQFSYPFLEINATMTSFPSVFLAAEVKSPFFLFLWQRRKSALNFPLGVFLTARINEMTDLSYHKGNARKEIAFPPPSTAPPSKVKRVFSQSSSPRTIGFFFCTPSSETMRSQVSLQPHTRPFL